MEKQEIKIPVPWGFIAAQTWGNKNNSPALLVHGWMDNSNTFSRLVPQLPDSYYYICIDLPSHGRSSPLETSLYLHTTDYVLILKYVYKYLNRGKLTIIGHSMGGFITLLFAQIYPNCISQIIFLDVFAYFGKSVTYAYKNFKTITNARCRYLLKHTDKQPVYTKETALKRMMENRMTPISQMAAEIIIERNLEEADDGKYRFIFPHYVKMLLHTSFTMDDILNLAKIFPIKCPHCVIISSNSSFMTMAYKDVIKEYKKNRNYEFHLVEGTHDVHLEHPERVAPIINDVLALRCGLKLKLFGKIIPRFLIVDTRKILPLIWNGYDDYESSE